MTTTTVAEQLIRVLSRSWWVVTVGLLGVGAVVQFNLVTNDDLGPLGRGPTAVGVADGSQLAAVVVDGDSATSYAGLDLAVVEARAVPVEQTDRPIVIVDLALTNTADVPIRVVPSMIRLVRPDGDVVEPDRFEFTDNASLLVIGPGETAQPLVVYKLRPGPIGLVSAHRLEIGEAGRWPVTLGLDGSVPEQAFPHPVTPLFPDGERTAMYQGLEVELSTAELALEHGVYRAPVGRHLLVATVQVLGPGANIDRSLWTLTTDDGDLRALQANVIESSPAGDIATVELVFSYPTTLWDLSVEVGRVGVREEVARFTVQPAE